MIGLGSDKNVNEKIGMPNSQHLGPPTMLADVWVSVEKGK